MSKTHGQHIIVFDTEYTSWEGAQARGWSGPGEYREIVEIGAVLVETSDFLELDSLDLYIRPKKNPKLSDYFINLTGITQQTVDEKGLDFADAVKKFSEWSTDSQMYSWGDDSARIEENCDLEKISFPFTRTRFTDVRKLFAGVGINVKDYMSSTIVRAFGEEPKHRGHNAVSDARTIVDGMRLLRSKYGVVRFN